MKLDLQTLTNEQYKALEDILKQQYITQEARKMRAFFVAGKNVYGCKKSVRLQKRQISPKKS